MFIEKLAILIQKFGHFSFAHNIHYVMLCYENVSFNIKTKLIPTLIRVPYGNGSNLGSGSAT